MTAEGKTFLSFILINIKLNSIIELEPVTVVLMFHFLHKRLDIML